MPETIQFRCACGKTLSADVRLAGKKAKCAGCGSVVQIPGRKAATTAPSQTAQNEAARPSPSVRPTTTKPPAAPSTITKSSPSKSIWDEDEDYELDAPNLSEPSEPLSAEPGAKLPSAADEKKSNNRRLLIYCSAFLAFCFAVLIVSFISPRFSLLLVMPVIGIALLSIAFGGLWYLAVLLRDNPGEASVIIFALVLGVFGYRVSGAGYAAGRMRRGRAANPSHEMPLKVLKFGFLCVAFGVGTALIVGILFGRWRRDVLDFGGRQPGFQQRPMQVPMQPPMRQPFQPPGPHQPIGPQGPNWPPGQRPFNR